MTLYWSPPSNQYSHSYRNRSSHKKPEQIIIVVSGPSTSERRELCSSVIDKYSGKSGYFSVIGLDSYRKRYGLPQTYLRGRLTDNLDLKDSYDFDKFYKKILNCNEPIVFVVGTIPFAYSQIIEMADICINLEYDYSNDFDLALRRRVNNNARYRYQSIPKDYLQNPWASDINYYCTYFNDIVWSETINHPEFRKPTNWNKPSMTLSATSPLSLNTKLTVNFIDKYISKYL